MYHFRNQKEGCWLKQEMCGLLGRKGCIDIFTQRHSHRELQRVFCNAQVQVMEMPTWIFKKNNFSSFAVQPKSNISSYRLFGFEQETDVA